MTGEQKNSLVSHLVCGEGGRSDPGSRGVLTGEWDEAMENPVPG